MPWCPKHGRRAVPRARDRWHDAGPLLTAVVVGWGLCFGADPAAGLTAATIMATDLAPRRVTIQSLRAGRLIYFDDHRELRNEKLERFVQIRGLPGAVAPGPGAPSNTEPLNLIELTDGQRLVGIWAGAGDDGQTVLWQYPLLGEVGIDLDQVRSIGFDSALPSESSPTQDTVFLVNGDRLDGFVVSVDVDAIAIRPQGGAPEPVRLPLDRVRTLALANPAATRKTEGHLVHLVDGSRLRAGNLTIARDELALVSVLATGLVIGPSVRVPLANVARIDLMSSLGRVIDLSSLKMTVTRGGRVFGLPSPPRIDRDGIHLHAPVTVRFDLPRGATRFSATAELDIDAGDTPARAWADMELIIRNGGEIIARHPVNALETTAAINLPLRDSPLTIELDSGINGPVMDRLWLRHPILFVRE